MEENNIYDSVLLYTSQKKSSSEIAVLTGLSESEIKLLSSTKNFIKNLSEKYGVKEVIVDDGLTNIERARKAISDGAYEAARTVLELARNGGNAEDRIRFLAAVDILDRAGLKPREVIETVSRQYTPEELESMNKSLREVEQVTMRLTNRDSLFLLRGSGKLGKSSSGTEKGSDVKNRIGDIPTEN